MLAFPYIPGKLDFVYFIIAQFYGPMLVLTCCPFSLHHYHHYIDVSEGIGLLNNGQIHSGDCVSKIK